MDIGQVLTTLKPSSKATDLGLQLESMRVLMAEMNHCIPVIVTATDGANPPRVDCEPLILPVMADGRVLPVATIWSAPVMRYQAGNSAVILDPVIGDKGLLIISDRDISQIIETGNAGVPPSDRRHSIADGTYVGGFINQEPTQYVKMDDSGIEVYSPTRIKFTAPIIDIDAQVNHTGGNINSDGDMIAGDISLINHKTSFVKAGTDIGGPPVA